MNASKSMFKILENPNIDLKLKHRVFNEFLIFAVKNSIYLKDIDAAIPYFDTDRAINVSKEVAKFFWKKNDVENAVKYFDIAIKKEAEDVDAMELYLEVLVQKSDFQLVAKKATDYLDMFPTQPIFYFYAGLGYNQIEEFKKGKNILESGLDFVIENKALEANFYKELIISCENLNDKAKMQWYSNKLNQTK